MNVKHLTARSARDARFESGLRSFFACRGPGILEATGGRAFMYEGRGVVRLQAGASVYRAPGMRHRGIGRRDDVACRRS